MNAPARVGIPLRADPTARDREWRRGFTRAATCRVLAQLLKTSATAVAREHWPDVATELITRSPVTPTARGDYPGSSISRLLALAPKSAAAQLLALATPVDLTGVDSMTLFPSPANFAAATFIAEGGVIPVRQGAFAGFSHGPLKKLALLAALSGELESASNAEAVIAYTLSVAIGSGLDAVLFSADPASAEAPAGLLFGVVPIAGSADMAKDLSALAGAIAANNVDAANVVFVMSASQALTVQLTSGVHFDSRVLASSAVPTGTIIGVAPAGLIASGDNADPKIDISKQALLNFADPAAQISTPGTPAVIAAPTVSLLQTDTRALRAVSRICWTAAPGSVAVATGTTW